MVNAVMDAAHKILSPATYTCALCAITHGAVSEHPQWKEYREKEGKDFVFLYRDEFEKQYRSKWLPKFTYPIILEAGSEGLQVLIGSQELSEIDGVAQLIQRISDRTLPG